MYYKYGIRLGKNPKQIMQLNRILIHSSDFPNSYRNFIQTCVIVAYNYDKINLLVHLQLRQNLFIFIQLILKVT